MNRWTRMAAVAGLGLALSTAGLASQDEGSKYINIQGLGVVLDDGHNADDDAGFALSMGRAMSEKWTIEAMLAASDHGVAVGQQLQTSTFGLNALRMFYPDARINPFVRLGLGLLTADTRVSSSQKTLYANYGVGFLGDISRDTAKGTSLKLRGEVYARKALGDVLAAQTPVDYVIGLGLQYNWGGKVVIPPPPDSDGDGVPDNMDKCPGTAPGTEVDANGCEVIKDADGDGVLDNADKCPGTPAGAKVDAVGCEIDSDGDGVVDGKDQCPNTPAGAKVDANGCELDSDGDGVVDSKDQCPDTPKGDRVDMFGCSFKKEIKLPGVVFDTASADLRPESYPILDGAAEVLKRYPELKIEVAGHTDARSSDAYNLDLSKRRAATVMKYLADKGVTNGLTSRGYGERQPVASNKTEEGMQQNRRVVLRVLN
jgi:OmpA-OmpF porin, OOP family